MPHQEKEVYPKHKDRKDFALIVIGREHTAAELEKLQKSKRYSLPLAPDPKREIYGKYSEKYIPRTFVIGKGGMVKQTSVGFTQAEFKELVKTIENELKR